MSQNWKVWDSNPEYGDTFYNRSIGSLPEMESSKCIAKYIKKIIRTGDKILDVGCGAGHYLVSLDKVLEIDFSYHGVDSTQYYIEQAKKAFLPDQNKNPRRKETVFNVADIYNLKLSDNFAQIVMCNNVLLHLPSIKQPLQELWRVTKKYLVIRTLIGRCSYIVKQVNEPEEYSESGEPINFNYLNIYSENFLKKLLGNLKRVKKVNLFTDNYFNPKNIGNINYKNRKKPKDLTTIVDGMQVNNYIIYPWKIIILEKK